MNSKPPLTVDCPGCQAPVAWTEQNPERPFCSKRCKDSDFIDWAEEEKRISGNSLYDDVFSDSELEGR